MPKQKETHKLRQPSIESVGLTDSKVVENDMKGLIEVPGGRALHYSPKRKYEPMLSIDRLRGHLKVRPSAERVTIAGQKSGQKSAEKPADVDVKEKTERALTSIRAPDDNDTTQVIRVDHVRDSVPEWMSRPKDKKSRAKPGLECVEKLRKFYIFDDIHIIDNLFEDTKYTNNCFTIRNADYQQLFYVGPKNNRQTSRYWPFTLRFIDQYSRHVISIKKKTLWSCCCGVYSADVECPAGHVLGHLRQTFFWFSRDVEFVLSEPITNNTRFVIKRASDAVGYEFEVRDNQNQVIGTIGKRFDKIQLNSVFREDHFVRVAVPQMMTTEDKVMIVSSAIIINIFFLRYYKLK